MWISSMKKYLMFFKLSMSEVFEYRTNMVMMIISGFVPCLSILFVWSAVYSGGSGYAGYTLSDLQVYTMLAVSLRFVSSMEVHWSMADDIRDGALSGFFVKPVSYVMAKFFRYLGLVPLRILSSGVILVIVALLGGLGDIKLEPGNIFGFVVFVGISFMFNFLMNFALGCLSFWLTKVNGVNSAWWMVGRFLSGAIFPIDMVSGVLGQILMVLPFKLGVFVPISALVNDHDFRWYLEMSGLYLVWIVIFGLIVRIVWRRGLKTFEAVGI